jgi:lysophospholipase L1-like esterase
MLSGEQAPPPGQRFAWFNAVVELDAQALRRAPDAPDGAYRIVVAGGSAAFGATLARGDEPWPALLERELAARYACKRPIAVRNAGRPGRTLRELTQEFAAEIVPLAPDLVIVYPGIDALAGLVPDGAKSLTAAAPGARASRVLLRIERFWRERVAARALQAALATPPPVERLRRGQTARRYRRLLVVAREHGIDVALVSPLLAVDGASAEARIRFHESVWPDTRRLVVANRAHAALLPLLGVSYRAEVLDLAPAPLESSDAFIDLVHPSAAGNQLLARAAAAALEPLLGRPDPGCVLRPEAAAPDADSRDGH